MGIRSGMLPRLGWELESCPALFLPSCLGASRGPVRVGRAGVRNLPEERPGGGRGGDEAGASRGRDMPAPPCFLAGPLGWSGNPGWHLEVLAHCPAQPGTQATAGQHAALSAIQEGLPGLATPGSNGCRELPSPALGPGKPDGILGGALGPQPSQPRILALKGTLDTEGAARPAQDLAKAWALVVLRLDQGQGPSCSPGRQPS